jgi:hypothetical protein
MTTALIGSTGFVGQNLRLQTSFDALYHSTDIAQIEGRTFDRVVCAGVTAVKWWANQNAGEDRQRIDGLIHHLDRMQTREFVLISTVDIYKTPIDVNETTNTATPDLHPYGANRLYLEDWARQRFAHCHILRLPALFGAGLKKNALFDLLHDNRLEYVDPASRFQWYPLDRLSQDIDRVVQSTHHLVNLVTEPVRMADIQARFFPQKHLGGASQPAAYDIQTVHADIFGKSGRYTMEQEEVFAAMARFIASTATR